MQPMSITRIHRSTLAAREREFTFWAVQRLPAWIEPDHLTIASVIGGCLAGVGFIASAWSLAWLLLAAAGLVMNWAGDTLDGNLARARRIERPRYGFFIDNTADVLSQTAIFMGMALSSHMHFATGCLLLMSYWLASLLSFIKAATTGEFQISFFGIGPTEINVALLFYMACLATIGPLPLYTTRGGVWLAMDFLGIAIFACVLIAFVTMMLIDARKLAEIDHKPSRPFQPPLRDDHVDPHDNIGLTMSDTQVP